MLLKMYPAIISSYLLLASTPLISSTTIRYVYFVSSNDADYYSDCPDYTDSDCFTFDHYTDRAASYFRSGSMFIFLSGNHTLGIELEIDRVSNMIMRADDEDSSVICKLTHNIIFTNSFHVELRGLTFLLHSYEHDRESVLHIETSIDFTISNMRFLGSGNTDRPYRSRAMHSISSNITITNSLFSQNTGFEGGAIRTEQSHLVLTENIFVENRAIRSGGAIFSTTSTMLIISSVFTQNEAKKETGGAINCENCVLTLHGNNSFTENHCRLFGGAIYILTGTLYMTNAVRFFYNQAQVGGAIYVMTTIVKIQGMDTLLFENNSEGAVAILRSINVSLSGNIIFSGNHGHAQAALYVVVSAILFSGVNLFTDNVGHFGGAMRVLEGSVIVFFGRTIFEYNTAVTGGAIYSANSKFFIRRKVEFAHNQADMDGGGFYASETNIFLEENSTIELVQNLARNGGGMYLRGGSSLHLELESKFVISDNQASDYGGGVFYEDFPTPVQCNLNEADTTTVTNTQEILPFCFLYGSVLGNFIRNDTLNTAGKDGYNLYGGLLDKCKFRLADSHILGLVYRSLVQETNLIEGSANAVSSRPYKLCFCDGEVLDCNGTRSRVVHRGQKINVFLLALGQGDTAVSGFVRAITSNASKLDLEQNLQFLGQQCSSITYTLYSKRSDEELLLYPDGPCHDIGLAKAVVHVTVLPCPDAFTQYNEECVCDERLTNIANCSIGEEPFITKAAGSMLWFNGIYSKNDSYDGLILYKACPKQYCEVGSMNVTLRNPDVQCAVNRSGMLCGACAKNFSLLLGSSRCEKCSNVYLALLLPFALAGIILTFFLAFFRLTVATGMINSVILFANIVQVNRKLFFPVGATNILTVFIAWINLDLGFEVCFFSGMDEYLQTWLQFVFPLYVWILISMIILISRYSILMSKLIGSNPIAVLATLLLMSYTKILKIVIEVYSSVELDYPNGKKVTVWLKDANIPYLQSKHLLLAIATSLVLVFFFFPYTLLLLIGHQLYRFSGRKCFHWLKRIVPLLDSYYAPYRKYTRHWTGLLLVVRCGLYIIFSYNSLGGESTSLLSIIVVFTAVTIKAWLSVRIYQKFIVNVLEASVYLNLIILSSAALANVITPVLTYTMVGIVFITTIGIIAYHFHILYTAKSAICLKLKNKITSYFQKNDREDTENISSVSPHNQDRIVSKTVIELREPLLDAK